MDCSFQISSACGFRLTIKMIVIIMIHKGQAVTKARKISPNIHWFILDLENAVYCSLYLCILPLDIKTIVNHQALH